MAQPSPATHPPRYWRPVAWLWGVLLGTAVQLQQVQLAGGAVYAVAAAMGCVFSVLLAWRRPPGGRWADRLGCLLAAAVLAWGGSGWRASQQWQQRLTPQLEGVDLVVEGTVTAMAQPVAQGQRFRLQVHAAWQAGQPVALPPYVDVAWYGSWAPAGQLRSPALASEVPPIRAGQRWRLPLRLKAPHGSVNPHGFDYELWMWEQGVQASGYVRVPGKTTPTAVAPVLLGESWAYPIERLRQAVRDAMVLRLGGASGAEPASAAADTAWPARDRDRERIAGVLVALVTGEQRAIDREDWRLFRTTGVAHLMAISGLHITLFAWVAAVAIGWLWRRSQRLCLWLPAPQVALAGGVVCALVYAVFSGWGVPAQRTVLMLAVVGLLRLTGRRWPWHATWLLACAVVVLVQPMALLQAGFWLSFVAVGILFASDFIAADARVTGAKAHLYRLLKEQWVVTLALTPLSLLLFGQISVVGLLANLLAIPWVTWVVTPLALLGVLVPWLWDVAAWCMAPLMAWLRWLGQWPHAALWLPQAPWWAALVAVLGGLWLVLPLPWRVRLLGIPLLLPALWWQPARPAPGQFSLLALDVGQGQAVLVQTARHTLLYDTGPLYGPGSNAGDRIVVPTLRALGAAGLDAGRIDLLVISHADADHTGGVGAVVQQLQPAAALGSLLPQERASLGISSATPWRDCMVGQAWTWDGVRFAVLHPMQVGEDAGIARSGNSRSCVLRIEAAAPANGQVPASALLAGDLEKAQEQLLVNTLPSGNALQSDVLLVPHHGSNTSSTEAWLQAVRPRWALVQNGYRNRFHHPASAVQGRYAALQIPLVSTVDCGAALWQSDAPLALQCERHRSQRFWRHPAAELHHDGATPAPDTEDSQPVLTMPEDG